MARIKRNRFLDTGSEEDESDRSYDSEDSGGVKHSKASLVHTRINKRQKTSHSESESEEDVQPDEVQPLDGGEAQSPEPAGVEKDFRQDVTAADDEEMLVPHRSIKSQDLNLPNRKEQKRKTGVVYLSRIPPFMKPPTVRQLLSPYGTITRLFLTPEPQAHYLARKKNHGNKKRSFLDGWVEFSSKKHAKACAETINGELVGGKKGGWYHDDIWNAKYLRGFKWDDLMESVRSEERTREERMRVEIRRETRERKAFLDNVEQSKKERGMEKKRAAKNKDVPPGALELVTTADSQPQEDKVSQDKGRLLKKAHERRFKQNEVRATNGGAIGEQPDEHIYVRHIALPSRFHPQVSEVRSWSSEPLRALWLSERNRISAFGARNAALFGPKDPGYNRKFPTSWLVYLDNALSTFASLAGVSLPPPPQQAVHSARLTRISRHLSTSLFRRDKNSVLENLQASPAEVVAKDSNEGTTSTTAQSGKSDLPWYLQVAGPPKQISPMSARQQLPPIPQDAPELLKPFLEHLSENIGLDDLVLLDLRALDPPPALGANLMMVIGTARSERHLHVSADRFCRWLRTNHKLSPYADGLLGRNELKLKMRRKARRIKLLSGVGSVDDKNVDDGIRTGWVCVNVGAIESGEQDLDAVDGSSGFVGFGGGDHGARLVVQMMTEEKREELDLETLWGGYVNRQRRKEAREAKEDDETMGESLEQIDDTHERTRNRADSYPLLLSESYGSTRFGTTQQRTIHTVALRLNEGRKHGIRGIAGRSASTSTLLNRSHNLDESFNPQASSNDTILPHDSEATLNRRGQEEKISDGSDEPVGHSQNLHPLYAANSSVEEAQTTLTSLVKHLGRLSPKDAREALGTGPHDESSTPFLEVYYRNVQRLRDNQKIQFHVRPVESRITKKHPEYHRALLFSRGVARQHPEYTKSGLLEHLRSLQESGSIIEVATYAEYIKGFGAPDYQVDLTPEASTPDYDRPTQQPALMQSKMQDVVTRDSLEMVLEVLEDMQMRGINLANKDILSTLCEVLARSQFSETSVDQVRVQPGAVHAITQMTFRHRLPVMGVPYYEQLLDCFANAGNWDEYWQCWRGLARRSQPRPPKLYQNLFRYMADTANEKMCLDALREWIPEMERETPSVGLSGDKILAYEIARCLRVADPRSEQMMADGEELGEWYRLWWRLADAPQPARNPQANISPEERVENSSFWSPNFTKGRRGGFYKSYKPYNEEVYNNPDAQSDEMEVPSYETEDNKDVSQLYALK